ncbi:MAG: hypothetical protein ACP5GI_03850 [Sulfolobales archaeon]
MPKISKYSCVIDLPRIVSFSYGEDLKDLIRDLFKELSYLYQIKCRIYMSLEPFTSNVSYLDKIYRIAFSMGSIIVNCEEYDKKIYSSKLCRKIGYFTQEDLWLRTREYIPCVNTYIDVFKEFFREFNIRNRCKCPSIIKFYSVEDFLKEEDELRGSENPILIFLKSENPSAERVIDIVPRETIYRAHPVSMLLKGLRTRCIIYSDVVEKVREKLFLYVEPILRSEELNVDLIHSIGTETIVSLCIPADVRDVLAELLLLYILFKKQDIVQTCSITNDLVHDEYYSASADTLLNNFL